MKYRKLLQMNYVVLLSLVLSYCGSQTDQEAGNKVLKDVEETTTISSGAVSSLAITDGSAQGTSVEVPADSLPEGTNLSLDRVEQPDEFSSVSTDTASPVIQISATDANGTNQVLASPMTLAIPIDQDAATVSLYLSEVERKTSNLCVLLKDDEGGLFVFRNSVLTVDKTENKVKLTTKKLGIYQLAYCGMEALENFLDASENDVASVPPGKDIDTFSSYGSEESSVTLAFDGDKYLQGQAKACFILIKNTPEANDVSPIGTVLSQTETSDISAETELKLSIDTKALGDETKLSLALYLQSASQSCPKVESELTTHPSSTFGYLFPVSKQTIYKGSASGALGKDAYLLEEQAVVIGTPNGGENSHNYAVDEVCLYNKSTVSTTPMPQAFVNTAISFSGSFTTSGSQIAKVFLPVNTGTDGPELQMTLGSNCSTMADEDFENIQDLAFGAGRVVAGIETHYLTTVSLKFRGSDFSLPSEVPLPSGKMCMQIFDSNYDKVIVDENKRLLRVNIDSQSLGESQYIPWGGDSELLQHDVLIPNISAAVILAGGLPTLTCDSTEEIWILMNDKNLSE